MRCSLLFDSFEPFCLIILLQSDLNFGLTLHGSFPDSSSSGKLAPRCFLTFFTHCPHIAISHKQQDPSQGACNAFVSTLHIVESAAGQRASHIRQPRRKVPSPLPYSSRLVRIQYPYAVLFLTATEPSISSRASLCTPTKSACRCVCSSCSYQHVD
jgi:hypothetical protein